jgi:predicted ATPase
MMDWLDPTQAEIQLALTATERSSGLASGTITWLTSGLSIEDVQ